MRRLIAPLFALPLAACVSGGASVQTVDGMALSVTTDDDYYWYETVDVPDGSGGTTQAEVFPLVTALVVARRDGVALTPDDGNAARQAVNAHCADQGLGPTGSSSNFVDGTWAFYPCSAG